MQRSCTVGMKTQHYLNYFKGIHIYKYILSLKIRGNTGISRLDYKGKTKVDYCSVIL